MKPVCFLIVLTTIAYAQQAPPKPSIQAESSGKCSPNILSNQGTVRFTCNAAIDKGTATKIVSLLNQILQKQGKENGASEVDQKLDEILGFLRNDAQAREPRHFTDAQKRTLIAALSVHAKSGCKHLTHNALL